VSETKGVSGHQIIRVIACESEFKSIQSNLKYEFSDPSRGIYLGEQEKSYGIAMIHLPDNPAITKEQALDPIFAIEFITSEFSKGNQWKWTCARNLGFSK